jgi:hypothetical protein
MVMIIVVVLIIVVVMVIVVTVIVVVTTIAVIIEVISLPKSCSKLRELLGPRFEQPAVEHPP